MILILIFRSRIYICVCILVIIMISQLQVFQELLFFKVVYNQVPVVPGRWHRGYISLTSSVTLRYVINFNFIAYLIMKLPVFQKSWTFNLWNFEHYFIVFCFLNFLNTCLFLFTCFYLQSVVFILWLFVIASSPSSPAHGPTYSSSACDCVLSIVTGPRPNVFILWLLVIASSPSSPAHGPTYSSSDCFWLRLVHRHRPNARPFRDSYPRD